MVGNSKHQRSKRANTRAVAHQWAATGVEHMVKHSRSECGRRSARGSRNWHHALQYIAFVAMKVGHGRVHLSNAQIAHHTGIDVRTVQRITSLAEASGILILEERGGRRRRGGQTICRANSWRLNASCYRKPPAQAESSALRSDENPSSSASLMGDTFASPDPLRGLQTPTGGTESAPPEEIVPPVDDGMSAEAFFEWVKLPKSQRPPL